MLRSYIDTAMRHASYELIDQPDAPYYGEISLCAGVNAIGRTLEECRSNLEDALDGWIMLKLQLGHEVPPLGEVTIQRLREAS
jgi:predicted RNase H-like HicB family nuclease